MKTLLFLNGSVGSQKGTEDGFFNLKKINEIVDLEWFYYEDFAAKESAELSKKEMLKIANTFQPTLIVFFHIRKFPISKDFLKSLRRIGTNPVIAYNEKDMYGGWSKPMTKSMELLIKCADIVSVCGLGKWYRDVSSLNKNTVFLPDCNPLHRYTKNIKLSTHRRRQVVLVGNKVQSRLKFLRRLPGASGREKIVNKFINYFGKEFKVYGRGWEAEKSHMGVLDFEKQVNVYKNNWFHLAYDHYPDIPFYFSDRLPIVLSCGQIYLCHYHKGYEHIFKKTDFIYFFKSFEEAVDLYNYLKSLSDEKLYQKSLNAKQWADNNLSPATVWGNFIRHVKDEIIS